jgi:hypothetical protein
LTESAPSKKKPRRALGQMTMGSFYTQHTVKVRRGVQYAVVTKEPARKVIDLPSVNTEFKCPKCKRLCGNQGGLARHQSTCRGPKKRMAGSAAAAGEGSAAAAGEGSAAAAAAGEGSAAAAGEGSAAAAAAAAAAGEGSAAAAAAAAAADDDDGAWDEEGDDGEPRRSKVPRLTKGGLVDRRGSNKGRQQRMRYPLLFKQTCLDKVRQLEGDEGLLPAQAARVVERMYNLGHKHVDKWVRQKDTIRTALTTQKHAGGLYHGSQVLRNSRKARSMRLGGGRGVLFPLAEKATYDELQERRKKGLRVGPRLLFIMMRKKIVELYGAKARLKSGMRWRRNFAIRWNVSLRKKSNIKAVSAAERLPKVTRWFARFRRRLRRGKASEKPACQEGRMRPGASERDAALVADAHRGQDGKKMVATQASHGLQNDCGLCAMKNCTMNDDFTLENMLTVARGFEEELRREEVAGAPSSEVHHLDETGNFSGKVIAAVLEKGDYGAYRLSKEEFGECGHARALVETLCTLLNARVCGVIWREGSLVDGSATSSYGHWLAASHLPNLGDWRSRKWAYKDSLRSDVPIWSTEQVLQRLDDAERKRFELFVVVDLA